MCKICWTWSSLVKFNTEMKSQEFLSERRKQNGSRWGSMRDTKGRDSETTSLSSSLLLLDVQGEQSINEKINYWGRFFVCRLSFYEVKIHSTRAWGQWRGITVTHFYFFFVLFSSRCLRRFCRLPFFFCCLTRPSYHKRKKNRQLESEKVCGWRLACWFDAVFHTNQLFRHLIERQTTCDNNQRAA